MQSWCTRVEAVVAGDGPRKRVSEDQYRPSKLTERIQRSAQSPEVSGIRHQHAADREQLNRTSHSVRKRDHVGALRRGGPRRTLDTLGIENSTPRLAAVHSLDGRGQATIQASRSSSGIRFDRTGTAGERQTTAYGRASTTNSKYTTGPRRVNQAGEATILDSTSSIQRRNSSDLHQSSSSRGMASQQYFSADEFHNVNQYTQVGPEHSARKQRRHSQNHQSKVNVNVLVNVNAVDPSSFIRGTELTSRSPEQTQNVHAKFEERTLQDRKSQPINYVGQDPHTMNTSNDHGSDRRSLKRRRLSRESALHSSSDELALSAARVRRSHGTTEEDISEARYSKQQNRPHMGRSQHSPSRDSGQSRLHAKDRMMAHSTTEPMHKVSPIDDVGSGDELLAATTIRSRAHPAASSKPSASSTARRSSPGELLPTQFSGQLQMKSSPPQKPRERDNYMVEKWFSSKSVRTSGPSMTLVWDQSSQTFKLFTTGRSTQASVSNDLGRIRVGPGRTSVMHHDGLRQVMISRPTSTEEHEPTCIEFETRSDASRFVSKCRTISDINIESLPDSILVKSFGHASTLHEQASQTPENIADSKRHDDLRSSEGESGVRNEGLSNKQKGGHYGTRLQQSALTDSPFFQGNDVRRSTRRTMPMESSTDVKLAPKRWTIDNKPRRWPESLVYPKTGSKRVTVDFQDLERLDEGEFLNDNVISFALRRVEEAMTVQAKERIHLFNTFFYSALTSNHGRKQFNYDAVKRWTKGIDIFTKSFVVIPINNDLHWFVAIICNLPKLVAQKEVSTPPQASDTVPKAPSPPDKIHNPSCTVSSANETGGSTREPPEIFEFDERDRIVASVDREIDAVADTPKQGRRARLPPLRRYNPDSCVIITLDSLGTPHTAEVRHLKDYIAHEAREKRGVEIDTSELQGMTAKGIPEQTNFCDCGLYLVGYVEQFAKDPDAFIRKVLTREMDRQSDFAGFDPSAKRIQLRDELLSLQHKQETDRQQARALAKKDRKPLSS